MEWPELFNAADRLSGEGQIQQKAFFAAVICANLLSALFAAFAGFYHWAAIAMFIALAIGVLFGFLLVTLRPQADWFNGRALAESIKTLSWRYVVCAEPYSFGLPEGEAERSLTVALEAALREANSISSGLFPRTSGSMQITDEMRQVRRLPLDQRLRFYVDERIQDQQGWYARKARQNRNYERAFSCLIVVTQFLAIALAAFALHGNNLELAGVGIITTLSSGVAAWQQQNQFGALASAYGMTAQELSFVQTSIFGCSSEGTFSETVLSAERAISREHTFWLARRRNP